MSSGLDIESSLEGRCRLTARDTAFEHYRMVASMGCTQVLAPAADAVNRDWLTTVTRVEHALTGRQFLVGRRGSNRAERRALRGCDSRGTGGRGRRDHR